MFDDENEHEDGFERHMRKLERQYRKTARIIAMIDEALSREDFEDNLRAILQRNNITTEEG